MRLMMFDAVKFRADPEQVASKRLGQRFRDALKFQEDFGASARDRGHAQRIEYFPPQPRVGVSRHGHVVDFRERQTRLFQTIADRLRGKSRGILDAVKSLLFDGGDQTAVAHNRRGSVSVVGINPEDVHRAINRVYLNSRFMRRDAGGTTRSERRETKDATRWFSPRGNRARRRRFRRGAIDAREAARDLRNSFPAFFAAFRATIHPTAKLRCVSLAREFPAAANRESFRPAMLCARPAGDARRPAKPKQIPPAAC